MNEKQAHQEAQRIAIELWQKGLVPTRVRAINDAFDAVEESTGLDLMTHRQLEVGNALLFGGNPYYKPRPIRSPNPSP